jgi:hypothetical protein
MTAATFSTLVASATAKLSGRRKSRTSADNPTDPVRAHSWDVDDPRAKPGQRIGDGTPQFGWAFTEALQHAARDLVREHQEQDYAGPHRMQRSYVDVLRAVLKFLDYRTGELTVPYTAIALRALVKPSTAKRAIAALEHWGLINHVRRSVAVDGVEGLARAPRAQAPNAYYFDCRRQMAAELWQRFWSRVVFNLKRAGAASARRAVLLKHTFNEVAKQAPRATGELGEVLARMRRDHFDDGGSGPSASPKLADYPVLQV